MNWNSGFTASYELTKIDPVSFHDAGSIDFISGTIDRTGTGLIESADLTMAENPKECLIRIYLRARQEDDSTRIALFTGLTSSPQRSIDGIRTTHAIECYSVLKPVADILVPRGYFAAAGAEAAQLVKDLLSVGPAPIVIDGESPTLTEAIVAEDTMSRLDVAWLILNAVGWRLKIEGNGTIHICNQSAEPVAVFDMLENDVIEPSVTDQQDWFSVPNCIRIISGDKYVEFSDDDPESAFSVAERKKSRGGTGEIWTTDTAPATGANESLAEYAMRILKEKQAPARTISYSRRFRPDVVVGDRVVLHLPKIGIDGTFRIDSQRIELGYGCRTSEEVSIA